MVRVGDGVAAVRYDAAMDLQRELESGSAPKIKKAAAAIAKERLPGYEKPLQEALRSLASKPKSWSALSSVIRAIGLTGSTESVPLLKELAATPMDATVLFRDLSFAICMLEDIAQGRLSYLFSVLDAPSDLVVAGACSALLASGFVPERTSISKILEAVSSRTRDEERLITPRMYIAAACYCWPRDLTEPFLLSWQKAASPLMVELATDALAGRRTRRVLV